MQSKTATVKNKAGIHCRPSSIILMEAEKYPGHQFAVEAKCGYSTLGSVLDLLALSLREGDPVTVKVTGPNENEVCEKLATLFEHEFDFA